MQIFFIFIADHAVHRIDGFIRQCQRRAAQHHIKQRRNHAVTRVLGDRFHCRLGHAFARQGLRIAPDNAADRLSRCGQIALDQFTIDICAFLRQSCRRQRLHAPEQLDRKAQCRMNRRQHTADSAREQQRSHRQQHRQKQPAHPFALRRIRQVLPQKCFQCADGFPHDDNGMHQPRRIAEYPIQYKTAEHRSDDSHAFSSA